jgi:hypothetical protein
MKKSTPFILIFLAFTNSAMSLSRTALPEPSFFALSNPVKVTQNKNTYSFSHSTADYSYLLKRFDWLLTTDNFKHVISFELTSSTFSATFAEMADEKYVKEKLLIFAEPLGFNEIEIIY